MDSKTDAQAMLAEIENLAEQATDKKLKRAYERLSRKVNSEIRHLKKQESNLGEQTTSNLPHLRAVIDTVKESTAVQETIYTMKKQGIVVDVICDSGRTWKKVVARNAQATHLIWAGKGQYGTKDVTKTLKKYLLVAEEFCEFSPPKVVCVFCNGVTNEMAHYLESQGVKVEGERVEVSADTTRRLQAVEDIEDSEGEFYSQSSHNETEDEAEELNDLTPKAKEILQMNKEAKIFLDVTTMVIYASDVCNGGAEFKFKDPVMAEQAKLELQAPVKPLIESYLNNRTLITCETALSNFKSFMEALGGEEEKKRGEELIERLVVVPDCVSPRFQGLKSGSKIKLRAKIVFGTADSLQCEILTSNESFVRAAAAQGVNPAAVLHQSRALSELTRLSEST